MTENERQPVRAFTVDETAAGERLDKFLSTVCPDLTRSAAARVIEEGGVLLDGAPGNKKDKLRPGTRVELRLPEPKPIEVLPEHIPLDVVYEDGVMKLMNRQAFAGSVATTDRLLRVAAGAGIPWTEALQMLTISPAKRIGLEKTKGRLAAGYDADMVLLDNRLEVTGVVSGGRIIRWERNV